MLVDVTFNPERVNKEFENRGVSFKSEIVNNEGKEFTLYSYNMDLEHEFWKNHKVDSSEVRFAVREDKGIYWGWNFDHMINDYFEENVRDAFAMFNLKTGAAATRKELRKYYDLLGEADISDEDHRRTMQEMCSFESASYGTADTVQQVLMKYERVISNPDVKIVFCFHTIKRKDQSPDGGWRWHKNGEYIGTKEPQHEYLYDDTHIDEIVQFHVYLIGEKE